jgi:methylase of polypeptide subunit release factors
MSLTFSSTDALIQLGQALESENYRFVTVTPATHKRIATRTSGAIARGVRDVFGWSRPFSESTLPSPLLGLMQQAGVVAQTDKGLRATVRASTLSDYVFFHSAYPTSDENAVFFGPDTYRFVAAIERAFALLAEPPRRVADVGCGAGAAAIVIARRYPEAEVVAFDVNQAALALTAVNARMAGADNVRTCESDLFKQVNGDFDLIVSNPPYLLDPARRAYRHGGGERGAGLSLAIVHAALARLRPGGSLLLYTGVAMTDEYDPFLAAIAHLLDEHCADWRYEELDPDVFGEELESPGYEDSERICAVWLHAVKRHQPPGAVERRESFE